ncbi:hypothetical protein AKJ16_DCAP13576 [Drosera capensis]
MLVNEARDVKKSAGHLSSDKDKIWRSWYSIVQVAGIHELELSPMTSLLGTCEEKKDEIRDFFDVKFKRSRND